MRSSSNKPLYYEHSGVVGVAGPVVMAATALATSVVVGAAFGIASKFNPFFYLDGVLAFFFGYGCGWVVGALGHKAKVRSEALTWITGIGLGLLCTYTGWVFWIYALSDYQRMLLGEPETVWAIIGRINAVGAWSVFGWQPTGYPLWAFWALELAVITFGAMKGVLLKLGQSVNIYCEDCRRWSEEVFTSPPLKPVEDGEALKSALEAGDFSALDPLSPTRRRSHRNGGPRRRVHPAAGDGLPTVRKSARAGRDRLLRGRRWGQSGGVDRGQSAGARPRHPRFAA